MSNLARPKVAWEAEELPADECRLSASRLLPVLISSVSDDSSGRISADNNNKQQKAPLAARVPSTARDPSSSKKPAERLAGHATVNRSGCGSGSRRRLSPPYTSVSRLLLAVYAFAVLSCVAHNLVLFLGVRGCSKRNMHEDKCKETRFFYVVVPLILREAVLVSLTSLCLVKKLWSIRTLRRCMEDARSGMQPLSPGQLQTIAGHWTAAASSDCFTEVTDMVSDAQVVGLLVIGGTVVWGSLIPLVSYICNPQFVTVIQPAATVCFDDGDGSTVDQLCLIGSNLFPMFGILTLGHTAFVVFTIVLVPTCLWGPASWLAATRSRNSFMRNLIEQLPVAATVAEGLKITAGLIFFVFFLLAPDLSTRALHRGVLLLYPVIVSIQLGHFAYSIRWTRLRYSLLQPLLNVQRLCRMMLGWKKSHGGPNHKSCHPPFMWECRQSLRYRQLAAVFSGITSWTLESEPVVLSWVRQDLLWVSRIISLALLLVSRDEEATFETLEGTGGAGFGLVVNAQQMRKALLSYLDGAPGKLRRVKRYKGTLLRMHETLTVSYRWDAESVDIDGLGQLNMSRWQLRQLAEAIEYSGCLYVWLDALSVPQDPGELKRVLLARMMSVYSCSYLTLVMLSREVECERYHQRVWTLQEYCSAGAILEVAEDTNLQAGDISLEAAKRSVTTTERTEANELRLQHLMGQADCLPVWLMDNQAGMSSEDAGTMWKTFEELSTKRFCLHKADKIRAMYPLLLNHPAERQEELVQLMDALEEVHGISQAAQRRELEECEPFDTNRVICDRGPSAISD